jgi:putative membrane protein
MRIRHLENILWNLLLVWGSVGILTFLFRIPAADDMAWADAFFMVLAAINITLALAGRDGWRTTLISLSIVLLGSAVIEVIGAKTGWPFGPYFYTDRLGFRLGGVLPFTIPLAWWTVLGSGHYLAALWLRHRPRLGLALCVATYATLMDWIMEPFAWQVKGYWFWGLDNPLATIPIQNYIAWWVSSFLLCIAAPWGNEPIDRFDPRPVGVAGLMILMFVTGRWVHGV